MEDYLQAAKRRGRPFGSKNKRKEPETGLQPSAGLDQDGPSMQLKVLEVAAGADVLTAVSDFANRFKVTVSIISTHGLVRNVKIYRPNPAPERPRVVSFEGVFNLMSLIGNFNRSLRLSADSGNHVIHFVYSEGYSVRGVVYGSLVAATKVILGVTVMKETDCIKLPLSPEVCSSVGGTMTAYGVSAITPSPSLPFCDHIANGYLCTCRFK